MPNRGFRDLLILAATPEKSDPPEDREPRVGGKKFVCPTCGVYAQQDPNGQLLRNSGLAFGGSWSFTVCESCSEPAVWRGEQMVWPANPSGPVPHADMPESVRAIYDEARQVAGASPRSAAALLRLAVETIVNELEPGSGSLNDKTGRLRQRGLRQQVINAMDVLRVFGNNGAHIGEIDLNDGRDTVVSLFVILNLVVENVITSERQVEELFTQLPEGARSAISRRDNTTTSPGA